MSPHININGPETPDEVPLAPAGVPLEFEVLSAEEKVSSSERLMLAVTMSITTEGDGQGDRIYDYFTEVATNKRTQVALVRLAKAVGVDVGVGGFDSEELIGQKGQFVLKEDVYQGKKSRKLQDYIVPKVG